MGIYKYKFRLNISLDSSKLLPHLVEAEKYRSIISKASQYYKIQESIIVGIGSRESGWGLLLRPPGPTGTGDFNKRRRTTKHRTAILPSDGFGFGRGLMQIDYDFHSFARTGNWQDPEDNIYYAIQLLQDYRDYLIKQMNLTNNDLLRAAISAYNCGPGNVLKALRKNISPDHYTTGNNYSADVLNRAGCFQDNGWN